MSSTFVDTVSTVSKWFSWSHTFLLLVNLCRSPTQVTGQMLTILKVYVWLYAFLVIDFYYSFPLSFLCSRDHSFCSFPYLLASLLNGLVKKNSFITRNFKRTYRKMLLSRKTWNSEISKRAWQREECVPRAKMEENVGWLTERFRCNNAFISNLFAYTHSADLF